MMAVITRIGRDPDAAMITAHIGARCTPCPAGVEAQARLRCALRVVALLLLFKHHLPFSSEPLTAWLRLVVLATAGAGAGFLAGMFGIGGGSLMVPTLVLIAGLGQYVAQGTSLLTMVPTGLVGARTHWRLCGRLGRHSPSRRSHRWSPQPRELPPGRSHPRSLARSSPSRLKACRAGELRAHG